MIADLIDLAVGVTHAETVLFTCSAHDPLHEQLREQALRLRTFLEVMRLKLLDQRSTEQHSSNAMIKPVSASEIHTGLAIQCPTWLELLGNEHTDDAVTSENAGADASHAEGQQQAVSTDLQQHSDSELTETRSQSDTTSAATNQNSGEAKSLSDAAHTRPHAAPHSETDTADEAHVSTDANAHNTNSNTKSGDMQGE